MGVFNVPKSVRLSMVDIHHDFEFVDEGNDGLHTISIGAVIEGDLGRKLFYGIYKGFFDSDVFKRMLKIDNDQNKWMRKNVMKHIFVRLAGGAKKPVTIDEAWDDLRNGAKFSIAANYQELSGRTDVDVYVGSITGIKTKLLAVVDAVTSADKPTVRQWCYYSAHDTVCFNNLFGGMMGKPDGWCNYAIDLRLLTDVMGLKHDDYNPEAKLPHHPLFDALGQYATAEKLRKFVAKSEASALGKLVVTPAELEESDD